MSRRTRDVLTFMGYSTFFGFLFPFVFMLTSVQGELSFLAALVGAGAICVVSGPGVTFLFAVLIPFARRFPFILSTLIQLSGFLIVGVLGMIVAAVAIASIGNRVPIWSPGLVSGAVNHLFSADMASTHLVTATMAIVFIGGAQVSRKLGPGVLWNWLIGKYHRPREERRIFMFLDVKDSTPLAEQLGNLKFSELIQAFFADLAPALQTTRGHVSHYIGDEAVIAWAPAQGLKGGNCVRLFFEMQAQIEENADKYRQKFGVVPSFRAGVHMGTVVAAEVGVAKSEIVYHGDAVNTTARVVGLCAGLGHDLLVSKDVRDAIGDGGFTFESMGLQTLKGKAEPMEVFAVESPP